MIARLVFAASFAAALPAFAQNETPAAPAPAAVETPQQFQRKTTQPTDWPCVQRKVPTLSPAAFWTGPEINENLPWRDDESINKLVPTLVSRRVSLEDAGKLIADFAKANEADKKQKLTLLFAGAFTEINNLRSDVIRGIGRFTKNQQMKSAQLVQAQNDLEALSHKPDKTDADQAKISDLETQVQWLQRIYSDREGTTRYICEVPTTLEQRLFAIARLIQEQLPASG
jgi:hypothetical protein